MVESDTRLRELSAKAIDGAMSEAEFAELAQLAQAKRAWHTNRAAAIAVLREAMQRQGIAIHELFSSVELEAALAPSHSAGSRVHAREASLRNEVQAKPSWVRRQVGPTLIEVPRIGRAGYPARYCMGQPLKNQAPAAYRALDDGQLETNLARYYTEYGHQYFATSRGREELMRVLRYVRGESMQPQTWVRKKAGLVLIEVALDGAHGLPCRYCKGQLMPFYVAKGWKTLDGGNLEASLERHFTDEGRRYFATDDGKAELAQLIEYLRTHRVKTPPNRGR